MKIQDVKEPNLEKIRRNSIPVQLPDGWNAEGEGLEERQMRVLRGRHEGGGKTKAGVQVLALPSCGASKAVRCSDEALRCVGDLARMAPLVACRVKFPCSMWNKAGLLYIMSRLT